MQQEPTIPQKGPENTNDLPPMPDASEPMTAPNREKKHEGWRSVLSTLTIIILAPLIALLLINFVFQSYQVDGPSMQQTLENADRLIVWKVPRTLARITGHSYIPNRNDIIVFTKHGNFDQSAGEDKQLIKRVIGLPGDRVVVSNGKVTIYNEQNPQGFDPDAGTKRSQFLPETSGNVDLTVNDGEVFVLGDNRVNSLDSRIFGPVKSEDIVGKLELRIYPFNTFEQF